jgi:hypothetical protein
MLSFVLLVFFAQVKNYWIGNIRVKKDVSHKLCEAVCLVAGYYSFSRVTMGAEEQTRYEADKDKSLNSSFTFDF